MSEVIRDEFGRTPLEAARDHLKYENGEIELIKENAAKATEKYWGTTPPHHLALIAQHEERVAAAEAAVEAEVAAEIAAAVENPDDAA